MLDLKSPVQGKALVSCLVSCCFFSSPFVSVLRAGRREELLWNTLFPLRIFLQLCFERVVGCSFGRELSRSLPMPSPTLAAEIDPFPSKVERCSACLRVWGWGVWSREVKFGSGSEGWFPSSPGERLCGMNHVLSLEFWAHRMSRPGWCCWRDAHPGDIRLWFATPWRDLGPQG